LVLTCEERRKCGSIIHLASIAAGLVGSGMAQIPLSDAVLIAPIQIKMLVALGTVFGVELTESAAKGLFASLSASCIGRATSQLLVGWIPVIGNLINAGMAVGITEAMGWLAVKFFQTECNKNSCGETELSHLPSDSELDEILSEDKEECEGAKEFCQENLEDLEEQLEVDQGLAECDDPVKTNSEDFSESTRYTHER